MTTQDIFNEVNQILINSDITYRDAQQVLQYFQALNNKLVELTKEEE